MKAEITARVPETLTGAIRYFGDADACHEFLAGMRWANGVRCPHCNSKNVGDLVKSRRIWNCKGCKKQFSVKVGTIFEDSPLGLEKWLPATWLIVNAKNGVSSCELARSLGVTQKTGWFMLHRIRLAMQDGSIEKMKGRVHTNGLENFWSLRKRGIKGTYVSVEPFHLFRYLDEQAFRFNERKDDDKGHFLKAIASFAGKRLMYSKLIGQGGDGLPPQTTRTWQTA